MAYSPEELIRRSIGGLLRGDQYHGKFLCNPCLVKLSMELLGKGYTQRQTERAVDEVFTEPGALEYVPTWQCDKCGKTMPCLGHPN